MSKMQGSGKSARRRYTDDDGHSQSTGSTVTTAAEFTGGTHGQRHPRPTPELDDYTAT
jgi:hypothetical protein